MTRAELAEAVNQYVWETTGKHCHLDVDTLRRYEQGHTRWPGAMYRDALRAVLGARSDGDLGFFPTRRGKSAAPDIGTWVASWPTPRERTDSPRSRNSTASIDLLHRAVRSYAPTGRIETRLSPASVLRRVATAFETYQAGRFEDAAGHAAAALSALGDAAEADPRVVALTWQITAIVLSKARHSELARLAIDRGETAADAAGDPSLRMSLLRTAAFTVAAAGDRTAALRMIRAAVDDFEPHMGRTPLAASVYGTMLLSGALLAAGDGDGALADTYLDEAQHAAQVARGDRNDLWTAFGPSNVAIHRTNVAAAMGDMDVALATGGLLHVEHLPTERQVRLHLDVARASLAVGDRGDALATLVRAEMTASSQVRHHHIARGIVTELVASSPRRPGIELARLANLAGVPLAPA